MRTSEREGCTPHLEPETTRGLLLSLHSHGDDNFVFSPLLFFPLSPEKILTPLHPFLCLLTYYLPNGHLLNLSINTELEPFVNTEIKVVIMEMKFTAVVQTPSGGFLSTFES